MEYSIEIVRIIEGALKKDIDKVRSYTNLLTEKLEKDGETRLANRLKKLISKGDTGLSNLQLSQLNKIPVDNDSRLSMADIILPNEIDSKVIMNFDTYNKVNKYVKYHMNMDILSDRGFDFVNSMLIYGEPGTGKTQLAQYIAKELNLPIVIARLDSMISSYLGHTAKNIRYLFEYIQKFPCVLFLDEFDAFAKKRDDSNELGELKRVVNSLLQNIDNLSKGTVLIAATNHQNLLDPAVWRRFSTKIEMEMPDLDSRERLIRYFLKDSAYNDRMLTPLAILFKGLSGADIENNIIEAIRNSIVEDIELEMKVFGDVYFKELNGRNIEVNTLEYARHLRNLDSKIFSYSVIGEFLGVTKSHIGNILR